MPTRKVVMGIGLALVASAALSSCAAVPVAMDSGGADPAKWQADNDECNRFRAANPNYLGDSFKDCMERKGYKRSGA